MARTVVTLDGTTWDVNGAAVTTNPVGATGTAGGDLTGTYPNPTLAAIGSATGPTGDGTHVAVVTIDAKGRVTALTSTAITGAAPTGSAGGDLTGTYPNPTLAAAGGGAAGPTGSATVTPIVTVDAKGRVTALSSATIVPTNAAGGSLTGNYPNPTLTNAARARDWKQLSVFGASVIGESIPRWQSVLNLSVLTTAQHSMSAVPVLSGDVLSAVSFLSATTAMSAQTNWWFALCDSAFNVIRQSTDQLGTGAWGSQTVKQLTTDSVPATAGARAASSTVTLTFPTLSQSLSSVFAVNDSVVVSNANIAAYNGTFTVATVTSTQITYVSGGSATDSLAAPFPTVQPAAGKRTYTVPADGYVYAVVSVKGTVPTLVSGPSLLSGTNSLTPIVAASSGTTQAGTCPSPLPHSTGLNAVLMCGVL